MGADAQIREIKSLKREQITLRSGLQARGVSSATSSPTTACGTGSRRPSAPATSPQSELRGRRCGRCGARFRPRSEPVAGRSANPIKPAGLNGSRRSRCSTPASTALGSTTTPIPATTPSIATATPSPATLNGRRETSGTALAGVVAGLGQRVLPIRIASFRAVGGQVEAQATTDQLLRRDRARRRPQRRRRHLRPRAGRARRRQRALRRASPTRPRPKPSRAPQGLGTLDRRARGQRGRGRAGERDDRLARLRARQRWRSAR